VPDLDRFRPILWAATAVCFFAAVVAVPIVGPGEPAGEDGTSNLTAAAAGGPTTVPADGATTTVPHECEGGCGGGDTGVAPTTAPAPSGGNTAAKSAGGPTTTTGAPTTTAAPTATTTAASDDLGAPKDPGPAKPSRVGAYRYKVTTSDGKTTDATTQVEDKGTANGETKQVVKLRGQGFDSDNDVAWRADGVYVLVSNLQYGENHFTCDWNPDAVQLRLPVAAGTTWESSSSCSFTVGATPVTVVRKTTGKIVELRRVKVAGQVVDVWAIDGTEHIEFAGHAIDSSGTSLFSPKHGLVVRSDSTIKSSGGANGPQQGTATMEIQNLDPE
jgi:hypothetical protein